jgi:hypothetical protein
MSCQEPQQPQPALQVRIRKQPFPRLPSSSPVSVTKSVRSSPAFTLCEMKPTPAPKGAAARDSQPGWARGLSFPRERACEEIATPLRSMEFPLAEARSFSPLFGGRRLGMRGACHESELERSLLPHRKRAPYGTPPSPRPSPPKRGRGSALRQVANPRFTTNIRFLHTLECGAPGNRCSSNSTAAMGFPLPRVEP